MLFIHQFHIRLKESLEQLVPEIYDKVLLLAVSGGPDSMVLLHSIKAWQEKLRIKLIIGHVHHGLRPGDADEDAALVRNYAENHHIPCWTEKLNVNEIETIHNSNMEESARHFRYAKLVELAIRHGCDFILTAHTMSDQAETILQRMARSAGVTGLCGILPIRKDLPVPVLRPFLIFSREEIMQYAKEENVPCRLDTMNEDLHFTRVRIRKIILPQIQEWLNPHVEKSLLHLSKLAWEEELYWQKHCTALICRIGLATVDSPADHKSFMLLTPAEQRRLLRAYCERSFIDSSFELIEKSMRFLAGDSPQGEIHFGDQQFLYRRYTVFYFSAPLPGSQKITERAVAIPGITAIPELHKHLIAEIVPYPNPAQDYLTGDSAEFDLSKLSGTLTVRGRREGDRMIPLGMTGSKKVKKILQEKSIVLEERDRMPLICAGDDIIWIPGCCASGKFKIESSTQQILYLQIKPDFK